MYLSFSFAIPRELDLNLLSM